MLVIIPKESSLIGLAAWNLQVPRLSSRSQQPVESCVFAHVPGFHFVSTGEAAHAVSCPPAMVAHLAHTGWINIMTLTCLSLSLCLFPCAALVHGPFGPYTMAPNVKGPHFSFGDRHPESELDV